MRRFLRELLHPERYHGHGRSTGPFFEGWYFKLVDAAEHARYAFIPGVFLGTRPAQHEAFVQVLDGTSGRSAYHRFPLEAFSAARDAFDVRIADSRFTATGLRLRLGASGATARAGHGEGGIRVEGEIRFSGGVGWPVTLRSPGIMGPYAWVPRMECYHGVVSLDHALEGSLVVDGQPLRFDGGRGYIEKDWGAAFPAAYVWLQSNHFDAPGTSLTASVALIPWLRSSFRGFIVGLWHAGVLHRFATYTGARIDALAVDDTSVVWSLRSRHQRLELRAARAAGGLLHAPVRTEMHRRVDETLRAEVDCRLLQLTGGGERVVFEGRGRCAGLEVHGDLERLLRG